jgi:hypothetical protein
LIAADFLTRFRCSFSPFSDIVKPTPPSHEPIRPDATHAAPAAYAADTNQEET